MPQRMERRRTHTPRAHLRRRRLVHTHTRPPLTPPHRTRHRDSTHAKTNHISRPGPTRTDLAEEVAEGGGGEGGRREGHRGRGVGDGRRGRGLDGGGGGRDERGGHGGGGDELHPEAGHRSATTNELGGCVERRAGWVVDSAARDLSRRV
ncbi:unnamed protein product [Urochloa decumbens]|uniref:Uncharacterized protein n=1 Tax=Urochloa decumbens TaxID=240449 RepID=A0ABC9ESF5_9POAL